MAAPVIGRRRKRIDDEDENVPHMVVGRLLARRVQRLERRQHVQHAAHADVVRDPTVDEMKIGTMLPVGEGLEFLQSLDGARGRPWRVRVVEKHLRPRRWPVTAGSAVVVDRDG